MKEPPAATFTSTTFPLGRDVPPAPRAPAFRRSRSPRAFRRPEYVFLVAGTVGGILANSTRPAEFIMQHYEGEDHINVGTGQDLSIGELAGMVRLAVHPDAEVVFDTSKPDGSPRELLDVTRPHGLGWTHRISLREGVESTYQWFLEHQASLRMKGQVATR